MQIFPWFHTSFRDKYAKSRHIYQVEMGNGCIFLIAKEDFEFKIFISLKFINSLSKTKKQPISSAVERSLGLFYLENLLFLWDLSTQSHSSFGRDGFRWRFFIAEVFIFFNFQIYFLISNLDFNLKFISNFSLKINTKITHLERMQWVERSLWFVLLKNLSQTSA